MSHSAPALHALILAAGGSRRLGLAKQLLEWRGETLLRRSVRLARAVCGDAGVTVVLGAEAGRLALHLGVEGPAMVVNPHWREGMGASLRCGLAALPGSAAAVLVLVVDQPLVEAAHLATLASTWRAAPDRVVASGYGGGAGVPAVFPRGWFARLADIGGDRGARLLLAAHPDEVQTIDCPAAEVDVDTPQDLARLR